MNEKTTHVLELHKILDRLASFTTFSAGADLARELFPTTSLDEARQWQQETSEARMMFENRVNTSLGGARDVRDVVMTATRGILIEPSVLLDIRHTLRRATTIKRTIGRMKGQYPLLAEVADEVDECTQVQMEIERVLDDNAEIRDTASPQLAIIRRDLKIAFDRLQTKLQRIISSSANHPYLQEQLITTRNGRYVIPLKADYKGKIRGVVHDSSSSGATLFIEPLDTVEMNNKWRELQLEEDKEIRRILAALTELCGNYSDQIVRTVEVLAYLDLVFAKAHYAESQKAVEPKLLAFREPKAGENPNHPGSTITLTAARHPLLTGNIVPIDVEFDENTWVLVVTGPNTGGKTVSLKTVGLLCLMAQCGLHVPAEQAKMSVFEGVFADIGDEQSIEQSLSTFSSHMTNTIQILHECDSRSLVLLDELGAGTDPGEGSALARAILSYLLARRVTTMVTTHHPELKIYSVETPGVRNASVEFDLETLAPTYRLIVGLPGRSNALAIAKRLGLNDEIIESARGMVAMEDLVADDLLDEIHRTREDVRRQQAQISSLRGQIEEEQADLSVRLNAVEEERRNIIAAARRDMQGELDEFRKEIRRLRKDMRDASLPLETLRQVQHGADGLEGQITQPVDNAVDMPAETLWSPKLNDAVWLEPLKTQGTVFELDRDEATVQVGSLRIRAKIAELKQPTLTEEKEHKRRRRSAYANQDPQQDVSVPKPSSPGMELDLRGARVEEALERLDAYIDTAYLSGLPFARIIHGKGTGALRRAVQEVVGQHPLISKVTAATPREGGDGVTIIHLAPQG